jgi:hypothetical protein
VFYESEFVGIDAGSVVLNSDSNVFAVPFNVD